MFENFKNEWNGRSVDYDNVYGFQCVDLILQFLKEYAGVASGVWGNAIDYATSPTQAFSDATEVVTDGSKKPGDILVFKGVGGNPYGHIALRDTELDKMLEQNGATGGGTGTGRDAIGVYRAIPTDRLVATYRIKQLVDTTPAPLPSGNGSTVYLPASTPGGKWRLYHVGSGLQPDTPDQKAMLRPGYFTGNNPPGITYKIDAWVGDYAVVITTQDYGRGVIWVKGTDAQIS